MRRVVIAGLALLITTASAAVDFSSSSAALNDAWAFAVPTALAYVQTGKRPDYIPSYWAGLLDRPAFYVRDLAHQALGAHVLSLDLENLSMMRVFAASATKTRLYFPLWSFAFNGSIYPIDYNSDTNYVRETPTPYDLLACAARLMAWTNDTSYATDAGLWASWAAYTGPFVGMHDPTATGIVGQASPSGDIFQGAASYVENGEKLIIGADSFAKQVLGFESAAAMLDVRGDAAAANATRAQAAALRATFATQWYTSTLGYSRGLNSAGMLYGYSETNSVFPATSYMLSPGPRTEAHLNLIADSARASGTELRTYVPEAMFAYGRPDVARDYITQLVSDPRRTYPEVSFTLVADLAVHLLGLEPLPQALGSAKAVVSTLGANLPSDTAWARARGVPLAGYTLDVTQYSNATTRVATTIFAASRADASTSMAWEARFLGNYATLYVNGTAVASQRGTTRAGLAFAAVVIEITPGSGPVSVSTSAT